MGVVIQGDIWWAGERDMISFKIAFNKAICSTICASDCCTTNTVLLHNEVCIRLLSLAYQWKLSSKNIIKFERIRILEINLNGLGREYKVFQGMHIP